MAMEDKDIIQLFFDRNEQAIEETSMKYGNYCSSIAMNILKNRADAEECVADTYQKCWDSIPPDRPTVFRIFLGRITRNLSFNMYKKMNADKRGSGQLALIRATGSRTRYIYKPIVQYQSNPKEDRTG